MSTLKSNNENMTINADGASSEIILQQNDTERMRLDSSGNVGIGTNSPDTNLSLYHATDNTSINVNTGTGGSYPKKTGISFGAISTSLGGDVAFRGGAGIQAINTAASGNPTDLTFWTNAVGTPTERMRILSSGGITFNGDTASANALDDYEEGTWTPTVHDSTTEASEGQTYAHNDGYYTKIGNTVHCWGKLQITSLGTMNTNSGVHIHGLPFATSSNTYFRAVTVFGYGASLAQSTAASLSGYSLPSSNNIYVLNWDTNSGITTLTIGELSVNANLHWYTVYRV